MNQAVRLWQLSQRDRSLESYEEFCRLCCQVDFNDVALKGIFCSGLTNHWNYLMPKSTVPWTLAQYMDFVLLLSSFLFPVGNADEEPRNPAVPTVPDPVHIMPAMPETLANMAATPESLANMATKSEPLHVIAAMPETPREYFGRYHASSHRGWSQANRSPRASNGKSSSLSIYCLGSPGYPTTFCCSLGYWGCHLVCLGRTHFSSRDVHSRSVRPLLVPSTRPGAVYLHCSYSTMAFSSAPWSRSTSVPWPNFYEFADFLSDLLVNVNIALILRDFNIDI